MQNYDVAAYVWPAYTGDEPRTKMFWPEGMGEWQSVKNSVSKFEGHNWPRKPLWGYVNEADPYVMEMQIEAAVDHGVNVFIYDWYWYDKRPFLENCLNDGFLKAKNCEKMKFYLMWANHNVLNLWDIRTSDDEANMIWDAAIDRKEFEVIGKRVIEKYFKQPNYYTIDNKPVFMIYDTPNLVKGLGGIQETKAALKWFNDEAVKNGLEGIHFQMTMWSENAMNLSGVDGGKDINAYGLIDALGYNSTTHYQYVHFTNIDRDYEKIIPDVTAEWEKIEKNTNVPYYPHVSIGWDNNPRFKKFKPGVMKNNTPENVEKTLQLAKDYLDNNPQLHKLITINSWNEWTETSYLQPDNIFGYGYLQAVKNVFKGK